VARELNVKALTRARQVSLTLLVIAGVLGMHGLTSVSGPDHRADTMSVMGVGSDVVMSADHGRSDMHPDWHDLVMCIWLVAGAAAVAVAIRRVSAPLRPAAAGPAALSGDVIRAQRGPPPNSCDHNGAVLRR
jgi:hypothetical protein